MRRSPASKAFMLPRFRNTYDFNSIHQKAYSVPSIFNRTYSKNIKRLLVSVLTLIIINKYMINFKKLNHSGQSSPLTPPGNTRKPKVFWRAILFECMFSYHVASLAKWVSVRLKLSVCGFASSCSHLDNIVNYRIFLRLGVS